VSTMRSKSPIHGKAFYTACMNPVEDREDCSFCRPASLLSRKIADVVFDRLDLCLDSKGVKFRKK
jgi:hypothetical protein